MIHVKLLLLKKLFGIVRICLSISLGINYTMYAKFYAGAWSLDRRILYSFVVIYFKVFHIFRKDKLCANKLTTLNNNHSDFNRWFLSSREKIFSKHKILIFIKLLSYIVAFLYYVLIFNKRIAHKSFVF